MTREAADPLPQVLSEALAGLDPPLPAPAQARLARLFEMLQAWKGAGIVGFRSPEDLARYYFQEAIQLRSVLPERGPYLDVGSGGGTPALPLALARGAGEWILLEPRQTAASFLEMAVEAFELTERVRVVRQRLKDFLKSGAGQEFMPGVSAVTLRAVKLQAAEWTGLAATLPDEAPVIWPTTREARQRATLPDGLFVEDFLPAERGVVWRGRPSRAGSQ